MAKGKKTGGRDFQPGVSGNPNGRPPGSGKFESARSICIAAGADPLGVLINFLSSQDNDLRFNAAKELVKLCHPQLKAVDMNSNIGVKPSILVRTDGSEVVFTSGPTVTEE